MADLTTKDHPHRLQPRLTQVNRHMHHHPNWVVSRSDEDILSHLAINVATVDAVGVVSLRLRLMVWTKHLSVSLPLRRSSTESNVMLEPSAALHWCHLTKSETWGGGANR